ncbi:MAG: LCP family protein [Clostridia bacterium]|nr:LCP family protein [Clostridia bacterium]
MAGKKKKKNKSTIKTVAKILAVLCLVLVLAVGIKVGSMLDFEEDVFNEDEGTGFIDIVEDDIEDDSSLFPEDGDIETLNELRNAKDLSTLLKKWATMGENGLMKSKNVVNFLIIGVDKGGRNSDVIMMMSLNKETKKIFLTSFFRDSYTYINSSYGDKYAKINAAYANGGAKKLIETLQNDYKIAIDHYVSVNFTSFVKIVDLIGGVDITVQPYEAKAVGLDCPSGENVHLNGEQALMFCRIRKCDADGDVSRTRRQRMFISSLIKRTQELSVSEVAEVIETLFEYVKTDCSSVQLISYATQALINKWYNYEIISQSVPSLEHRMDYRGYAWVWIVDYPAAAKELHETIYGESNIELAENRVTAIDIMRRTGNTGSAKP